MKSATKIKQEIDTANMAMLEATQRIEELEQAGDASEKAIAEMGTLTNKGRLLQGAITRLEKELADATFSELQAEIADLRVVIADETAAAEKATDKLAAQAIKLLVPDAGCTPTWTSGYCDRRRCELASFARQHPSVTRHTEAASRAKGRIERAQEELRNMAA